MNEETIGVIIAALALGAFVWFTRGSRNAPPIGSNPPVADALASVAPPSDFNAGPSYFISNQPWWFGPPIGNIMPAQAASRTIATNEDQSGCGCG
jgi:hypothetical protein